MQTPLPHRLFNHPRAQYANRRQHDAILPYAMLHQVPLDIIVVPAFKDRITKKTHQLRRSLQLSLPSHIVHTSMFLNSNIPASKPD